jgi:hypothetical protein
MPTNQLITISTIHQDMILNEKLYQEALKNDEKFKVLKGFKESMKQLKLILEAKLSER